MTTIVWDGKTLAADRLVSAGGVRDGEVSKIVKRKKDGALAGGAGPATMVAAFHRWFLKGEKGERPALRSGDTNASCFIIRPDRTIDVHEELGWFPLKAKTYAVGSGYELAYGAIALGAHAVEAIQVAMERDTGSGGAIDALELGK